jgi:hypothetical protein
MKKFLTAIVIVLTLVSASFADDTQKDAYQKVRLGVNLDYFMPAMDQVNADLGKGSNVTKLNGGVGAMADLNLALLPYVMAGVRTGYLYCMPGNSEYNYIIYDQKTTLDAALIPVEIGLNIDFDIPSFPAAIMVGAYAGYGVATASYKNDINALGQTATYTVPYIGSGFVGELLATLSMKLSSVLSVNINGGYKLADIAQMKQAADVNFTGIPGITVPVGSKNDVLKDSNNKDMAFDFSGLSLGVGAALSF